MNSCYRPSKKLSSLFNYKKSNVEAVFEVCIVCFGVLHFSHLDDRNSGKKKEKKKVLMIWVLQFLSL